jgi:threonine dehydrogenase-like Zn-dependent dehydrogenase
MLIKQGFIHGARDLRLDTGELSDAPLAPDELLVKTEVTALSTGTDIGNYVGDSTYIPTSPGYPRAIGYSNVGTIVNIGEEISGLYVGQRVFSTKRHVSAYRARRSDMIMPIPDLVPSDVASLSYLAQLSLSALRQSNYQSGESVAVVGLGVIGLTGIAVARALGARTIAIGNSDTRLTVAEKVGAHYTIPVQDETIEEAVREACSGNLADIVILAADKWAAYRTSMQSVRYGGRVAILGFPGRWEGLPSFNPLDPAWLWQKRLSIFGSGFDTHNDCQMWDRRFTTRRNLGYILDLLNDGVLKLAPVITHRVAAEDMRSIYELAASHSKDLITAVFKWGDSNRG